MASEKIITTSGESFQKDVIGSDLPVLVDFWAEWCGPCRMVAPLLEDLAETLAGKVRIAKLDVDHNQDLAFQYQVSSIPTLILFKDGKVADRMLGALPKSAIQGFIERNL